MKTDEQVRRELDENVIRFRPKAKRVTSMTLEQLLATDFPEPKHAVEGVIPRGFTLLAGRPKLGKSWLALDIALAATNRRKAFGSLDCEQGDVLLLALEDGLGRLKARFTKLGASPSPGLDIHTEWPRGKEAVDAIARWHDAHQATGRMVFVDTITRIKPPGVANRDAYQADAQNLEPLQQLAVERDIAVVAVGHTRKAQSDDWLDSVIGTSGVTGTADAVLVLKRERGQADAVLHGTGRDICEFEKPLRFDEQTGRWTLMEVSGPEARAGEVGTLILDILRRVGCGMTIMQIASATGRSNQATFNALDRLEGSGLVRRVGKNLWDLTKQW